MTYLIQLDTTQASAILREMKDDILASDDTLAKFVDRNVRPYLTGRLPIMAREPGESKHPFAFATPKSRRKYFAMIANGEVATTGVYDRKNRTLMNPDDAHYVRTERMKHEWGYRIDRRSAGNFITIFNSDPAAGWVYGAGNDLADFRQVPGHHNTGWGETLDRDLEVTTEGVENIITDGWLNILDQEQ